MFLLRNICLGYRCLVNIRYIKKPFATKAYIKENEDLFISFGFTKDMMNDKINRKILTKRPTDLKQTLQILFDSGFKHEDIVSNAEILHFTVWSIDHRLKLAEEAGFFPHRVNLSLIRRFPPMIQKSIIRLKRDGLIKESINVTKNILSYTDLPKELYPSDSETTDNLSLDDLQVLAMKVFLKWKLNLSEEEIQYKFRAYPEMRMSSIRMVMKCYDVLINELRFPEKMIKNYINVLFYCPSVFYDALENLPMIRYKADMSGVTRRHILKIYPMLLTRPVDSILKILGILKRYGIDLERHHVNPDILALSPETVRQRLKAMKSDPIFRPLFLIDAFPLLVLQYNEAKLRSEFLREAQQEFHNFKYLVLSKNDFEGRLKNGVNRRCGSDLVNCLSKYLKMDRKLVREELKKNPFCHSVPLIAAWRTLEFLSTQGYTHEQLKTALTLVLYPQESVEKELQKLESRGEVAYCRDLNGQITPELKLQLCLYFLEKPYHFSGQGIWAGDPPKDFFTLNDRYLEYVESKKNKMSGG